jgi:hypothetical protein
MSTYTNGIKLYIDDKKLPIGDPFIYEFHGTYYLYPSTHYNETNIRCFTSKDLVNWTYAGLVTDDPITKNAYAPEIIYAYNQFYLSTSPGGNGHYIFVAKHPLGPFKRITNNIGEMIDGTFFYENKKLYFARANHEGITVSQMNKEGHCFDRKELHAPMHGWTEGPHFINKDKIYYMTYCGNFIESDGYRVNYGYANQINGTYSEGINNPLVISTKSDFKALGHSMNVLGPNLLDYYVIYHQLYFQDNGIPTRDLCVDRLQINGKMLAVNPSNQTQETPKLPTEIYEKNSIKFLSVGNKQQSKYKTSKNFVVVYEFKGTDHQMFFDDHQAITINEEQIKLELNEKTICVNINEDTSGYVHLRIISLNNKLKVYINHHYIETIDYTSIGGHIGFKQSDEMYYCAYTNIKHAYTYKVPGTILLNEETLNEDISFNMQQQVYELKMKKHKEYQFNTSTIHKEETLVSLFGATSNHAKFIISNGDTKKTVEIKKTSTYYHFTYDLENLIFENKEVFTIELIEGSFDLVAIRFQPYQIALPLYIDTFEMPSNQTYEEIISEQESNHISMLFNMKNIKHHKRFGFMYKVNHYSKHEGQSDFGYNGYFIGFRDSLLVVEKASYGLKRLFDKPYNLKTNKDVLLEVTYKSGVIKVYIDKKLEITTFDSWSYSTGALGIYADELINVEIKEIISI